jgi:hypothetical protein
MAVGMDTRRPLLQGHQQRSFPWSLQYSVYTWQDGEQRAAGSGLAAVQTCRRADVQACRRRSAAYPRMAANVKASTSAGSPIRRCHVPLDKMMPSFAFVFRAAAVRALDGMIPCSTARPSALAALANIQSVHCVCSHDASPLAAAHLEIVGKRCKDKERRPIHGFTPHDHHKCQTSAPSPGEAVRCGSLV